MCTEYEPLYQLPQTNIPIIVIKSVYFCIRYSYCTIYVNARICWNTSLRGRGGKSGLQWNLQQDECDGIG